jgi:hypothetical protein
MILGRFFASRSCALHRLLQKTRYAPLRRCRRHVPWLDEPLERREVLSPFPFTGTYSGGYTVYAESDGHGPNQEESGTISATIATSSIQPIGDNVYDAYIYGSVTFTGFAGQSGTFPIFGSSTAPPPSYNQGTIGVETAVASTGIEPSVDIVFQAYCSPSSIDNVLIQGYFNDNSIVASLDLIVGRYATPNAASVVLTGATSSSTSPTPTSVGLTGGNLVPAKRGASQIVVDFIGPLGDGSGLPVSDFRLTTVPKGRRHAEVIPLKTATYDGVSDTMTLVPRRKQKLKLPLELTVSGLAGGPYTLGIDTRG